jgi:hypothetical protein
MVAGRFTKDDGAVQFALQEAYEGHGWCAISQARLVRLAWHTGARCSRIDSTEAEVGGPTVRRWSGGGCSAAPLTGLVPIMFT